MARKFGGTQAIRDLEPAVARPQSGYQLMFAEEATAWLGGLGEPSVRGWEREGGHRTLAPRARPGALTREPEATRLYDVLGRSKTNSRGSAGGWSARAFSSG